MLKITRRALRALKDYIREQHTHSTIRITMMHGCCAGNRPRFTLSEWRENDLYFVFEGITFLVDRVFAAQCGNIEIDFEEEYDECLCSGSNGGFHIRTEKFSYPCSYKDEHTVCSAALAH